MATPSFTDPAYPPRPYPPVRRPSPIVPPNTAFGRYQGFSPPPPPPRSAPTDLPRGADGTVLREYEQSVHDEPPHLTSEGLARWNNQQEPAGGVSSPSPPPRSMSRLEVLQAQARELNRQLAHELWLQDARRSSPAPEIPAAPPPPPSPSPSPSIHPRAREPALEGLPRTPRHPIAVLAPSYRPPRFANPWKGDHNITRLNAFIRQARAWILGVGKFGANDDLASAAPDVHLLVLSVFSSEPGKGQETSAADWADAQFRRAINAARVLTLNDLFRSARHRWPDPGFAARVEAELTALRQGNRHAMEFLSLFEAKVLEYEDDGANVMTERDQAARFLRALNPSAQQLCHTQIGHRDPYFHTSGVFSAGLHPTLEELSRWASAEVRSSPVASVRAIAPEPDPSSPPTSPSHLAAVRATRPRPRTENADQQTRQRERWVARAVEWQRDHPAHQRNEWVRISSAKRICPSTLRCYNCGLGGHFADDCKNSRVSPNQVVIASVAQFFDIGPSGREADEVIKLELEDLPVCSSAALSRHETMKDSRGDLVSSFRALLIECLSSPLDQPACDETRAAPVVRAPRTAKAAGRGARIERLRHRRPSIVASDAGPPSPSFRGPRVVLASPIGRPSDQEFERFVDVGAISLLEEQKLADKPPSAAGTVEPRILRVKNVLLWTTPSGRTLRCLLDSGAEIDVIDSRVVQAESSFVLSSLMAPLHLRLGTGDATDRLSLFASAPFASGALDLGLRPFFVGQVSGYDAILGLPFLSDSGMLVGAHQYAVHSGPSQPATLTSQAPLPSLEPIPWGTAVRSLYPPSVAPQVGLASLVVRSDVGVSPEDEIIGNEPRNPLLDVVDEPDLVDWTEEEARTRLDQILSEFDDVFVDELPIDRLPPFRPVNHKIPLIDPSKKVRPKIYTMADRFREQWRAQVARYTKGGWWTPAPIDSASPIFAIPKKNSDKVRFVLDLWERNLNTHKMFSPIPDMRTVRADVARSPFRSKVDVAAAFEQVRVVPRDVPKTGFATVTGTYTSRVMQFGDTNAPNTLNLVTNMMFQPCAEFLKIFFDDIHLHSPTRRAHLRHIRILLTTLRYYRFYLGRGKTEWFSPRLDSLGAVITDDGITVDPCKWERIRSWPRPRNILDVQRFLRTINWMRDHLPQLSTILAPITRLTSKSVTWVWTEREETAFAQVKALVPQVLRPIDGAKVLSGQHRIFVATDASTVGIGACLSSGPTYDTAVPFRFHSAKFNPAQSRYNTTDQELLAVVTACKEFEQHLLGYSFTVLSDNAGIQTFHTQAASGLPRQVRMYMELSRFDFHFEFIPGKDNHVADSLSRLWESPDATAQPADHVQEPELDDLFFNGPSESPIEEGAHLAPVRRATSPVPIDEDDDPLDLLGQMPNDPLAPVLLARRGFFDDLPRPFTDALAAAYATDRQCAEILADPVTWQAEFRLTPDHVIYRVIDEGHLALVVPQGLAIGFAAVGQPDPTLRELALDKVHRSLAHAGSRLTLSSLRRDFWWSSMSRDCADFCRSCGECAQMKATTAQPFGRLHPMPIPSQPWEQVAIDFVTGLPPVEHDREMVNQILVVTDTFGKLVHLLPLPSDATSEGVAEAFYRHVYKHHGVPSSIVSDRDPKFTAHFWKALQRKVGTELRMSTSAHPQTDGASENQIKMVVQSLRLLCAGTPDNWAVCLTEAEFALNSATAGATGFSGFETSYGFQPRAWPVDTWTVTDVPRADAFADSRRLRLLDATDAILGARLDQSIQANKHRRPDSAEFQVGNRVYLSTKNLAFPPGQSRKFLARYIGPFTIVAAHPATSNYDLDLPPEMSRVLPRFHASLLRPHFPNDDKRFPGRSFQQCVIKDVADPASDFAAIDVVLNNRFRNNRRSFLVRFVGRPDADDVWIDEAVLRLQAPSRLDEYIRRLDRQGRQLAGPTRRRRVNSGGG